MKEISKEFEYKGKEYKLVFNLNVMEVIQDKYGTLENWGKLTDGIVTVSSCIINALNEVRSRHPL